MFFIFDSAGNMVGNLKGYKTLSIASRVANTRRYNVKRKIEESYAKTKEKSALIYSIKQVG
ncbi:hypothetical protein EOM81_12110 [bacterium]|nr:hypothetical protein [bacterium]